MRSRVKNTLKSLTPPILWESTQRVVTALRSRASRLAKATERSASYYDRYYRACDVYRCHYTASHYYFLWSVIGDRMMRDGVRSVLDIGCGPGQVAKCLQDRGLRDYRGLDLSQECIKMARLACPEFSFTAGDVFKTDLFEKPDYDATLCLEVLEHVEQDTEILKRIRSGVRLYATVPNFPHHAHVRVFSSCDEVCQRYSRLFRGFRVDAILADHRGKTYYLFEGVKE